MSGELCPSGRCQPGATLLGIRTSQGGLVYTPRLPALNNEQAERFAANGGSATFRFTEPCVGSSCGNWSDDGCGVARAAAVAEIPAVEAAESLPKCGIRATCRWFRQEGSQVCHICPFVLRDAPDATIDSVRHGGD